MARIVRSENAPRVRPAVLVTATEEAERIVARARQEAQALLDAARDEAELLLREAALQAEAVIAARTAASSIELEEHRRVVLEAAEPDLLVLAGEIAKRAVEEAFELDASLLAAHVASALAHARRARRVRLHVGRGQAAALGGRLPESVVLVEDDTLGPGDCLVESDVGHVDARIGCRIDRLVSALGGTTT